MTNFEFDYTTAFSRNIGWVTAEEQRLLRHKRVAIAGMGGVGGSHLLTLARLGIGAFNIADLDTFELANFNRQAGAAVSKLEKSKVDVLADMALDINPELDIKRFPKGVSEENLAEFFSEIDIYVDGLDFFAFDIRQKVFDYCHQNGIPAVTAAPLGMGTALLNFLPDQMSFADYFGLNEHSILEKGLRFLIGLAPAGLHGGYLVDPKTIDLENRKGPSTAMGCELCAGVAASQVLKILLGRGDVRHAPYGMQFDAYKNKTVYTWRPGGHKNPLQRMALSLARRHFLANSQPQVDSNTFSSLKPIERIMDVARWAPSGDNTQPWRFEIIADDHLVIHGHDTRDHCVYDLHGHPSQMALGALLESIKITATEFNSEARCERRKDMLETQPTFDVYLQQRHDKTVKLNPLNPFITIRRVQRRSMLRKRLTNNEKQKLEKAVASDYRVLWIDGWKQKLRTALLMFRNAKVRLTMPEAYEVHRSIIEWNAQFSEDKIPDKAIGLDPITTRMMRWTLKSWTRVKFFNTFLAGTVLPRIELDLIPGINCAAHFVLVAKQKPETVDDYISAGGAMQRFWLTATKLGLQLQPEMTPLIFSSYLRENIHFTEEKAAVALAEALSAELQQLIGEHDAQNAVFMGRIGYGKKASARSTRMPLIKLMVS